MTIYIALLQGVNVGKHKRIAMADLKRIVEEAGGTNPVTLANSGNAIFAYLGVPAGERVRATLETAIGEHVGGPVPVILRTAAEMRQIVDLNPYPEEADPKRLHVEFLGTDVTDVLTGIDFGHDHLTTVGREIYLHLPHGISGLTYDARTLGKRLGTQHTSRNWNTVTKLTDIASGMEESIAGK